MKKFSILKAFGETRKDIPYFFPWHLLNEDNAQRFHSQSLDRLNQRGGLTCEEIYCNMTSTKYHTVKFNHDKVVDWVKNIVDKNFNK